jgi:hypothetical protein
MKVETKSNKNDNMFDQKAKKFEQCLTFDYLLFDQKIPIRPDPTTEHVFGSGWSVGMNPDPNISPRDVLCIANADHLVNADHLKTGTL